MIGRARIAALTGALAAAAALLAVLAGGVTNASAATTSPSAVLKSFNAGDIISDQVMFNPDTMTQAQVQSFLDSMVPTCENVQYRTGLPCLKDYIQTTSSRPADPMCGPYTGAKNETAAAIIVKVGRACSINPQVLLVLLQKEQGLVTDSWPTASQYRKATGYGCPDSSSVCDATYNGFYNQVYMAAWAFQRYTMPPGTGPGTDYYSVYSAYPVGEAYPILYQDPYTDSSCGSKSVVVQNKATHSLYYYTPYTPNAAALAAGFGSGDPCSAYGNRNFFLYFTQWFGSTHITVSGAIATYWNGHGAASGSLGAATSNAVTTVANGGGTYQRFEHGMVFTSQAGTFAVTGAMLDEYKHQNGVGGSMQWPLSDAASVTANGGGSMQRFGAGDLYSSRAGTFAVLGDVRSTYASWGGVTGSLGFPATSVATLGTGVTQHFTGGSVYFHASTGGFGVPKAVDTGYSRRNGPSGELGWPVAAARSRTAAGLTGAVESFQQGDLYVSSAGTAAVLTPVSAALSASPVGGVGGVDALGWPTADATTTPVKGGGTIQPFTAGRLYVPTGANAVTVSGAILARYLAGGEVAGGFGWPVGAATSVTAQGVTETVQAFQTGAAYQQGRSIATVRGATYTEYTAEGGPSGTLGWVTGPSRFTAASGGVWSQSFSGGSLYYSSTDKHTYPVTGALLSYYRAHGEAAGSIGRPIGMPAPVTARSTTKTVQPFATGSAYVSGSTVTIVGGRLYAGYLAAGGPSGALGWPTAFSKHTADNGGGWTETFQGGTMFYSSTNHWVNPLSGAYLSAFTAQGGTRGTLGWPGALQAVTASTSGTMTVFTNGRIYSSSAGTNEVKGGIGRAYLAKQGPAGPLGWPTTGELPVNGRKVQRFQHGTISWVNSKAVVVVK